MDNEIITERTFHHTDIGEFPYSKTLKTSMSDSLVVYGAKTTLIIEEEILFTTTFSFAEDLLNFTCTSGFSNTSKVQPSSDNDVYDAYLEITKYHSLILNMLADLPIEERRICVGNQEELTNLVRNFIASQDSSNESDNT